ncbi:MAG: hypothetical protein WCI27_11900, partial [Candidatus Omnitrophota bacterium]
PLVSRAAGDGVLHLGATGYVFRSDAEVTDLDYQKDFSVEVGFNIEANTGGGRWAALIAKTAQVYDASSGFALALNQGHFDTFGQQVVAKVSDGTSFAVLTSPSSYQGLTSTVMTFNAAGKILKLYVNGTMILSDMTAISNLAGIKNIKDLVIGKGIYNGTALGRDILVARWWNRELSAGDIQALSDNLLSKGSHAVPSDVSLDGLLSEWRMQEMSDGSGNAGVSHIKDTVGANHLQLAFGAALWLGDGEPVFQPVDEASHVSPAVVLNVSGGSSMLSGNMVRPLSYQFQIDETSGFNSSALKDSGWLINIAAWKPVLKPGTTYYWRVRVKDASVIPVEGAFSMPVLFQTRSARSWYVRPGVYTGSFNDYIPIPKVNIYGTQDGSSYLNAWNGIRAIVWGEHGVAAGDDVYVCGSHYYAASSGDFFTRQSQEIIKESGYSDKYPVTIRMDCPSDPGAVWGVFQDNRNPVNWAGPDVNGVYTTKDLNYGTVAQMTAQGMTWLKAMASASWVQDLGAVYFDSVTKYTSLKTVDGSSPAGKDFYSPGYGFRFNLSRSSYIRFFKAAFYNSAIEKESLNDTITTTPPSQHIL